MSRSALEYLHHILDETGYLIDQTQGLSRERFMRDVTLQRAFVRSIEIIGEASKQVPDNFKQKYGHVEWRAMAGRRLIRRAVGSQLHRYALRPKNALRNTRPATSDNCGAGATA